MPAPRHHCLVAPFLIALSLTLWPTPAEATYSIAAFDHDTGRFGAATASCVPIDVLQMVYAQVPGEGAVLTQSYLLPDGAARTLALNALANQQPAAEVLASLTDPAFDPDFELRQYAVFDPSGGVAAFTGTMTEPHAAHRVFSHASFEVVVAGNFLTGEEVLLAARDAFSDEDACDLEARLMNALVAASAQAPQPRPPQPRGDARCVVDGQPAQSALIHVGRDDGDLDLAIGLPSPPPDDPVQQLAAELEAWRAEHPCPQPTEDEPPDAQPDGPPEMEGGCTIGGQSSGVSWPLLLALTSSCRRRRRRHRL